MLPGTFQEPATGPTAGTSKTLGEIAAKLPAPDNTNGAAAVDVANGKTFWGLRTDGTWGLKSGTTAAGNNVTGANGLLSFTIPDAFYTGAKTATAVDSNLLPGNIKSGVSIFGVAGTSSQASGTAAAADVLTGKTFSNSSATGINGAMANNGAVSITPGTAAQTISAGYHNGSGSVGGDANLVAGNIKSGATIFGVNGTASQASGTAAAADVLSGTTFSNGSATGINGAMANNGAVSITPGTAAQTILAGYHNGSGSIAGDANLVAGNIKNGVTLFGVTGTLAWVQPNAVPVANAGAVQNVTTGTLVTLNGLASSDANGDALTYKWTLVYKPSGSSAALNNTAFPLPSFTADADGGYVFLLIVNDGKVDSAAATVTITAAPDTTAPITTAAPSVSGAIETAATLSVTINKSGTGYYLVRLATAPVPTVAEVQAGTSFAMTAYVADTRVISGLIFNTPYTIYFIAKDALNNVQAAVQSVAVTTAPTTTAGYVTQGGLTWMPNTVTNTWANANAYCTNTTINGVSGWRMPTQPELSALQASNAAMSAPGWALTGTWSSTQFSAGFHYGVGLGNGNVVGVNDTVSIYVSCVR